MVTLAQINKSVLFMALLVKLSLGQGEDFDFNYKDIASWTGHYLACAGQHQSPIDITTSGENFVVKENVYPPLTISGFNRKLPVINVTNNGHTAVATVSAGMTISGGPVFEDIFSFIQLHFHWGYSDCQGSEHLLDGKSFVIESHFVLYNLKYHDETVAMNHEDGLMVIAVWGELSKENNTALEPIVKSLPRVLNGPKVTMVKDEHMEPLRDLLPDNMDDYYHYSGSLTTPTCSESVTWILFKNTIQISEAQLREFRKLLKGETDLLSDNFRPIQPLDGRIVELVTNNVNHQHLSALVALSCTGTLLSWLWTI